MTEFSERRFYIERDDNGLWDVVDGYRNEYLAINLKRGQAERLCNKHRLAAAPRRNVQ